MTGLALGTQLWSPSVERIQRSGLNRFMNWVNQHQNTSIKTYDELWRWSVDNVPRFWESIWLCYGVGSVDDYACVLEDARLPFARWFVGARLNMAEYLLRQADLADPSRVAIFAESECFAPRTLNWLELRDQVARFATYLRASGVSPGDRVAAYIPISIEAVVAKLACLSIGAVWSSCSPDFGAKSVLERFQQIEPKVLITVTAYRYNGKVFDRVDDVNTIVATLPSLERVVHLPWLDKDSPTPPAARRGVSVDTWHAAISNDASYAAFEFAQLEFDHPAWILYTSGTTGLPKGVVHGQGGVLLEFIKFAWLHDDLGPDSVKFFYTSAGWTMFNLLVGGFACGSAIVVYDGCPTWPNRKKLWEMTQRCRVTYFGTSPTYINALIAAEYSPAKEFDLSSVRTFAMTGSPVSPEHFAWVYENVGTAIHVFSMSGGTDVATAFVGGACLLPVRAGEIQAPCLAVDVCAFDDEGNELVGAVGELVIRQPMPSMPIYLWNDASGERYKGSYFDVFPNTWRQGDLVSFKEDRSCVISGRSDATLNRYGIRIGTSEIYRNVESIEGVKDSLIVNLELPGGRFFMPLFVVLNEGVALDDKLKDAIGSILSRNCSPRHVPDKIVAIAEVPYTLTGKKQEVPVKKLLMGMVPEKAFNRGACANPGAIQRFVEFAGTLQGS